MSPTPACLGIMTPWHTQDLQAFTSTHLDPRFYAPRSVPPRSPAKSMYDSSSSSGGRQRAKVSCTYCRLRKIRCDGGDVCSSCRRTRRSCEYTEVSDEDNRAARERKAFLKAQKLATGFAVRSPTGISQSVSCPDLPLLKGWQPKTEASSSSSFSRPFPSVLLPSPPLVRYSPAPLLASPKLYSTYSHQPLPSPAYTSYFPSSASTPNLSSSAFSTPPPSPLYPTFTRFDDGPSASWIIPPSPVFQTPTHYPHTSIDLSISPLGPSTYIPIPEVGLGVGFDFDEFKPDASTFIVAPPAEHSFIPQLDLRFSRSTMGEDWRLDASWEAEEEQGW